MAFGIASPASAADTVTFTDSNLAECVADALGLADPSLISNAALADLTELTCNEPAIGSLVGLEQATNLEILDLNGALRRAEGSMTSEERSEATLHMLDPLTGLAALWFLDIDGTPYSREYSTEPLATLPALSLLAMQGVRDRDLAWLAGLDELTLLDISDAAGIDDVADISGLDQLAYVGLHNLTAQDLAPLTELPNLTYLDLLGSWASAIPSFTDSESLRGVDLSYSHGTDLGDFGGSGLEYLDISGSTISDLTPVRFASELTELYADDTTVEDLAPLAGLAKLEVLSLYSAYVADLTPLKSLPKLTTLDVDNNRILDISPVRALPALTDWTAVRQFVNIPAMNSCTLTPITMPVNLDGSHMTVAATKGFVWNGQAIAPGYGYAWFTATSNAGPFDVTQRAQVDGASAPCEWPSGWLPTLTLPTQLTLGVTAKPSYTGGIVPGELVTEAKWAYTNPADGIFSTWLHFTPEESDLKKTVQLTATLGAPGMTTTSLVSQPMQVWGRFPDGLGIGFLNPPLAGYTSELTTYDLPSTAAVTCAWFADGIAIKGATACEYKVPSTLAGKKLSATVTLKQADYITRTYTVPAKQVLRSFGAIDWIGRINPSAASDRVNVGAKLTATPPTYKAATATSFAYQWTRNGAPIPGAKYRTYTVTSADAGKSIRVEFTALRAGYAPSSSEAIDVFKVRKLFTSRPAPAISGSPAVGYTLAARTGAWIPTPSTYAYQWYRNGKAISGATRSTYKATSSDAGQKLTVKVTSKRAGYTTASRTSASVTILKRLTPTPTPTISGTARVKSTLTAKPGAWGPGTVTLTYQWYRNGTAIPGATTKSYTPSAKDAFASFKVKVTGRKSGYLSVRRTSTAITASGIAYASCAALRADYPGGVATSSSTPGILSTTFVSSKLYALNAGRDSDMDGWACE